MVAKWRLCAGAPIWQHARMSGETAASYARAPYRSVRLSVRAGRWSIAWVVVAVLAGLCIDSNTDAVKRVLYLRHGFSLTRTAQIEIAEHRARHGDGPDEADLEQLRRVAKTGSDTSSKLGGRERLQIDRGSFNLRVGDDLVAGNLTWRLGRADGDASVFWICGYSPAPGTVTFANAPNLTDVPPRWLPPVCRAAP